MARLLCSLEAEIRGRSAQDREDNKQMTGLRLSRRLLPHVGAGLTVTVIVFSGVWAEGVAVARTAEAHAPAFQVAARNRTDCEGREQRIDCRLEPLLTQARLAPAIQDDRLRMARDTLHRAGNALRDYRQSQIK